VVVAGGPAAVADTVVDEVAALVGDATVVRLSGDTRYATAAAGAMAHTGVEEGLLATAGGPFDALAAAALAVERNAAVLLTDPDVLPAVTAEALASLAPDRVTAVGGQAVVSDEVLVAAATAAAAGAHDRLAGSDRYATAAVVALAAAPDGADVVWLASGTAWVDALAAAASGDPVLLVAAHAVPASAADAIGVLGPVDVRLAGGTAVVGDAVESAVLHGTG
ncbi:MAG: cell wall-binding repeat-containing protein, partial [Actinomycetota bacterium]